MSRCSFGGVRAVDGVSLDVARARDPGPRRAQRQRQVDVPQRDHRRGARRPVPCRVSPGCPCRSAAPAAPALGVLRTYQTPQTYDPPLLHRRRAALHARTARFTGLTVGVVLARPCMLRHERSAMGAGRGRARRASGCADLAEQPAARLSYGQRRLLELARGDRRRSRASLLLDEPSAGLDAARDRAARSATCAHVARRRRRRCSSSTTSSTSSPRCATASRCSSSAGSSPSARADEVFDGPAGGRRVPRCRAREST